MCQKLRKINSDKHYAFNVAITTQFPHSDEEFNPDIDCSSFDEYSTGNDDYPDLPKLKKHKKDKGKNPAASQTNQADAKVVFVLTTAVTTNNEPDKQNLVIATITNVQV